MIQADGGTLCFDHGVRRSCPCLPPTRKTRDHQDESDPKRVAAVSVGIIEATPILDLAYTEDSEADVDMNIVCTGSGKFIELQGTAEREPFSREQMDEMLILAEKAYINYSRYSGECLRLV